MTNVKTEPLWSADRVKQEAELLYDQYYKALQEDKGKAYGAVLMEICQQKAMLFQIIEHLAENWKVSNGAANNSSQAVKLFQQLEGTIKTQGASFSQRLEKLERE